MKLGNVSQSIVPVPKFFLNNKSIDLVPLYNKTEIYFSPQRSNINKKRGKNKSYYRTKDILALNLDFNINLNPRPNHKNANAENKKRYIPLYNIKNLKSNSELKGTYFPDIIYMNNNNNIKCIKNCNEKAKNKKSGIEQYKDYKKSTNIEQKINPDLHSDIIHNTENLISKINMNLDLKRWYEFDSRTTFNLYHQTAYSPITDYNKKIKNEKEAFSETLKNKALGLKTVSNKTKAVILKNLYNKK